MPSSRGDDVDLFEVGTPRAMLLEGALSGDEVAFRVRYDNDDRVAEVVGLKKSREAADTAAEQPLYIDIVSAALSCAS